MRALSDFHLHTFFSSDSTADPEEYILSAVQMGLQNICFTDHNDFDAPLEDGKVMFLLDFDKYVRYMSDLKQKYRKMIHIYIGVEQGLVDSATDRINAYDQSGVLDFIIGSSHLVYGQDPYYPEFWENVSAKKTVETYYQSIIENVNLCRNYDVYGHLDYIIRYIPKDSYHYDYRDFSDYIDTILKLLISKGKGIEINTAGLRYGLSSPNPCEDIVKRYCQLGGEIITIGSDAHETHDLAYRFDIAKNILQNAGFEYYTIFKQRKPEFLKLV